MSDNQSTALAAADIETTHATTWTWERGRGKPGVGKAVYRVTHDPNGFPMPDRHYVSADHNATIGKREICGGIVFRGREHLVLAVWQVKCHRDHRYYTGHYCDECLPADERPGTPKWEAANEPQRRPKLTDVDKLHRHLNKIGGVDGIAEGHYAVDDPHHPDRVTTWRIKDGKFGVWPANVRVGPISDVDWRGECPRRDPERRVFIEAAWQRQRAYHAIVRARIADDPEAALARYSAVTVCCCCCNRALSDVTSVGYGCGPECRRWMPAETLAAIARHTSELRPQIEQETR